MARKKQQLINYHTSGVTNMPQVEDVALGELVVRHATDKPELLIKKDNNEFATFIDSTSIDGKLETLKTYIEGQIDSLESASTSDLKAFSATVVNTYATSADTESAIATAKSEAVSSGKGYTDGQINAVTSAYTKADADLASSIEAVSGSVSALSEELRNEIADKVSSAYIYKGSVSDVSKLPANGNVKGDVYNVINANGAPGDVNYTPAGTNYAWDGEKWDALGGVVDLSNYATTATTDAISTGLTALQSKVDEFSGAVDTKFTEYTVTTAMTQLIANAKSEAISSGKGYTDAMVAGAKKAASDAIATTNSNLSTLSGSVDSFSATVVSDYATKVIASGYAMTAEANAVASGKGYTDGEITKVTTAYAEADSNLDARIDELEAISAQTQSAVQNVVVDNTDANKITATKTIENNVVTLNFDNMVINCGDF